MISITSEQAYLLELLKGSLFNTSPRIPDEANWDKIFEEAKSQYVLPLVLSYVPPKHRNKWLEYSYQSKARNLQLLHEQNSIVQLLKDNDIPFVILKGTAASMYYPVPSLRPYGDIDIYISEDKMLNVRNLLDANGYVFLDSEVRHCEYLRNGFEIEIHSRFSSKYYNDIEHLLLIGLSNAVENKIGNISFPTLPPYENGLVLLGHIMMHLKTSGIGLRQIIDWMMFVHNELNDYAWNNHFKALAVEAGLDILAKTVTFMCIKWLGLPARITWCNDVDEEVADQLLFRILIDGNFGIERAPYESIKYLIKKEGFFKYLQRTGMEYLPIAQKIILLMPFAWIYALFRLFYKGISRLVKGEKVFRKGPHSMSLEELLQRLG